MEQHKTLITYIVVLFVLAVALAATSIIFGVVQNPFKPESKTPGTTSIETSSNTPTPNQNPISTDSAISTSSSSASASAQAVKKITITVLILNGSGTPGQAAKVQDQLVKLGYQGIKTGNSSVSNLTQTTIEFSKKVPENFKVEIIKSLEKTFTRVISQTPKTESDYDISITTGQEK